MPSDFIAIFGKSLLTCFSPSVNHFNLAHIIDDQIVLPPAHRVVGDGEV
jgi:hypothetical protein